MRTKLLALGFAFSLLGTAHAEVVMVKVKDIKVSQEEFGRANVGRMVVPFRKDAQAEKTSMLKFVRGTLKKKVAEGKKLPGVINPDGEVVITDGHHRAYVLARLDHTANAGIEVPVDIQKDYRGWSHGDYAHDFIHVLGKGQFRPEHANLTAAEKMKRLPASLVHLKDNPMRAIVGAAMYHHGLDSAYMVDYVEFKVGEKLLQSGVLARLHAKGLIADAKKVSRRESNDDRVINAIREELKTPEIKAYVLTTGRDAEGAAKIRAAYEK